MENIGFFLIHCLLCYIIGLYNWQCLTEQHYNPQNHRDVKSFRSFRERGRENLISVNSSHSQTRINTMKANSWSS